MSTRALVLVASLLTVPLFACGGKIAPDDGTVPTAPSPTASADPTAPTPPDSPPPAPTEVPPSDSTPRVSCGLPVGPVLPYDSATTLEERIVGKWQYCSGDGHVGPADAIGIEVTREHRWYFLRKDDALGYRRAFDPGYTGFWFVVDTAAYEGPGTFQLDFDLDEGGGTYVTQTVFTDGPRRMHLHHHDGTADYLKLD